MQFARVGRSGVSEAQTPSYNFKHYAHTSSYNHTSSRSLAPFPLPLRPLILQPFLLASRVVDELPQTVLARRDRLDGSVLDGLACLAGLFIGGVFGVHVGVSDVDVAVLRMTAEEAATLSCGKLRSEAREEREFGVVGWGYVAELPGVGGLSRDLWMRDGLLWTRMSMSWVRSIQLARRVGARRKVIAPGGC